MADGSLRDSLAKDESAWYRWRVFTFFGPDLGTIRGLITESARVGGVYLLAQIPGFFVPAVIAATFGATSATDVFFLAFAVASFIVNSVSGAAQAAVPFFVLQGRRLLWRGTGLLVAIAVGLLLAALLGLGQGLDRWSGLDAAQRRATPIYLVALGPFVLASTLAALWSAAINAGREYRVAGWAQGARSVAVVGLVLALGHSLGLWGLVLAFVTGELLRALILWARLSRPGPLAPPLAPADHHSVGSRALARSLVAQVAGSAILGAVPIIDRAMASSLGPGSVSVLEYAERIWQVPLSLAMTGFTVVSLTEWSRDAQPGSPGHPVRQQAAATARVFFVASLPLCLAFVLLREPITRMLFGYGAFPDAELSRLAATLAALVVGIPPQLAGIALAKAFLAWKRSDLLLVVNATQLLAKIPFNLLLTGQWGTVGLALSTSIMHGLGTLVLLGILRQGLVRSRRFGDLDLKPA
jgi:putative peptidoglycan lipid II flippase